MGYRAGGGRYFVWEGDILCGVWGGRQSEYFCMGCGAWDGVFLFIQYFFNLLHTNDHSCQALIFLRINII